jgi:hypothetical protein
MIEIGPNLAMALTIMGTCACLGIFFWRILR